MVAQEDEQNEMHDMLETIVEETEEVSLHEHRATVSEDMLVFLTQASYGPKIGTSLATMLIQDLGIVNGKLLTLAYSLPLKATVQGFTDKAILAYQEDMMRLYYYVRYVRENLQSIGSPSADTQAIAFTDVDPAIFDLFRRMNRLAMKQQFDEVIAEILAER